MLANVEYNLLAVKNDNNLIISHLGVTPKGAAPFRASLRSVLRTLRPSRQLTQKHK